MKTAFSLLAAAALLVACADSQPPPAAVPTTTSTPTSTSTSTSASTPTSTPTPTATGAKGTLSCAQSPALTYDKSCASDADCAVARTQVCCGDIPVVGVRAADKAKVEAFCPCPSKMACRLGPLQAEDHNASKDMNGASDVKVACVAGACTTSVH